MSRGIAPVHHATTAIRSTLRDRRARVTTLVAAGVYLLSYLYAIDMLRPGNGRIGVVLAADPLGMAFRRTFGPFTFEQIAVVYLQVVTVVVSLNVPIGMGIALLFGLNVGAAFLVWRRPAACGIEGSSGVIAGVPALLSGTACCAPTIAVLFGIQLTGGLMTAVQLLVPAAVVLLLATLVLIGRTRLPATAAEQYETEE